MSNQDAELKSRHLWPMLEASRGDHDPHDLGVAYWVAWAMLDDLRILTAQLAAANERANKAEAEYTNSLVTADRRIERKRKEIDAYQQEIAALRQELREVKDGQRPIMLGIAAENKKLRAELAEARAWEPVSEYSYTEHLNLGVGKPSVWQRVEIWGRLITIDRDDSIVHAALLPRGMGLFRRTNTQEATNESQ